MRPLNPRHPLQRLLVLTCGLLLPFASLRADDYADKILPILKDSCLNCHSTKKQKGDVDLEQFATVADIRRSPKAWEAVLEQMLQEV